MGIYAILVIIALIGAFSCGVLIGYSCGRADQLVEMLDGSIEAVEIERGLR